MKTKNFSLVTTLLLSSLNLNVSASEDLGLVTVESSTINVKTDKKTEVSNVDIIDEETIKTVGPKNLVDILKTVPGMTSVERAGEMMQIRFRGVGQQQYMGENPGVAIIVDGVPVMAKSGGLRINMADIKSIKIVKGSASYLYGDGALAGALIITTKKPKGKNESMVSAEIGSYGYQEYTAGTIQGTENFAINLNASKRSSDGYWREAELWTQSFNGKFSYYVDDTSDITLGVDLTEKFDQGGSRSVVGGVTEAETNPKGEPNSGYTKDSAIDLNKYFLTYSKDFGNKNLMVTAYNYQDLYDDTSNPQDLDNDPTTQNVYVKHSNTDLNQKGIKSEFTIDSDNIASLIGLEFGKRDYENKSQTLADYSAWNYYTKSNDNYYEGETSHTNSKEDIQALYGELKYNITSKLTTTINARYNIQKKEYITQKYGYDGTTWSNSTESVSHTYRNTAYRAGATYSLSSNNTLFTSVSTGFQNPEVRDLVINPSLKEQTSINYEIGARGREAISDNNFNYEVSIFQLDNKDIIGPVDGSYAFSEFKDNIGDSRSRGLELSLNSNQAKILSFNLAYTYLDVTYTKHNPFLVNLGSRGADYYVDIVGKTLPRVSKHTVDLFVNYKATDKLKFIAEVYAKSSYYADESNLVKMDGYTLLNLQARYNTKFFGNNLECFVKVDNALDKQYYRAVFLNSDKRGAADGGTDDIINGEDASITVDPGRVFYAGVNYRF
ncbi:TonB-dependent receptor [Sulfurimonas sp.]|jgi:iron complex outermembrane receptor protein|uniref:TonB-dependent receptor n=1 Tax=Sulfurimonas sp. TaxID=2022749 RepID=UPI0025E51A89|nr:TonB-dependent receptor [Sulfurimonas sp.]MCK9473460.1 TonB-dependent receptor [Sulfurimonas sp.]